MSTTEELAIVIPEEEPVEDVNEPAEVLTYRYSITGYGADYPVDGLVKRLEAGDVVIPTFDPEIRVNDQVGGFQRQFVWTKPQCDKFIESLLLGFPVPGIFLVKQADGRFLVLDGQQRLRTLQAFYKGILRGKVFTLEDVQPRYRGRTYASLDDEDRRHLDDSIIHATIIRQEQPSEDQSSVYMIFERLNTGGTLLQPQEIRVALYQGQFVNLLRELNGFQPWRQLYGKISSSLKDQELILRFFAMFYWSEKYAAPMKEFLNKFMGQNRDFQVQSEVAMRTTFQETAGLIFSALGPRAFRLKSAVNAAVADAVMVGVARRLTSGKVADKAELRASYEALLRNEDFLAVVSKSTANEDNVKRRLTLATAAFAAVA
ncbi:MAG TPA: DUF262 domain-containing protein [Thermoanaerobaculia bacterium]|nr:DUF262 domain-containing protein [Thermoanaerobaculia bacterium]